MERIVEFFKKHSISIIALCSLIFSFLGAYVGSTVNAKALKDTVNMQISFQREEKTLSLRLELYSEFDATIDDRINQNKKLAKEKENDRENFRAALNQIRLIASYPVIETSNTIANIIQKLDDAKKGSHQDYLEEQLSLEREKFRAAVCTELDLPCRDHANQRFKKSAQQQLFLRFKRSREISE